MSLRIVGAQSRTLTKVGMPVANAPGVLIAPVGVHEIGPGLQKAIAHSTALDLHQVAHAVADTVWSTHDVEQLAVHRRWSRYGSIERYDRDAFTPVKQIPDELPYSVACQLVGQHLRPLVGEAHTGLMSMGPAIAR